MFSYGIVLANIKQILERHSNLLCISISNSRVEGVITVLQHYKVADTMVLVLLVFSSVKLNTCTPVCGLLTQKLHMKYCRLDFR